MENSKEKSRLKIDIPSFGNIEVEGGNEFVKEIYQDFREKILSVMKDLDFGIKRKNTNKVEVTKPKAEEPTKEQTKRGRSKTSKDIYKVDDDLMRKLDENKFKEFYDSISPSTNINPRSEIGFFKKSQIFDS